jgi:capsular exopolysaccharide synthesis family protein
MISVRRCLSDALQSVQHLKELADKKDAIVWLAENLRVRSPANTELMEVSYQARAPGDAQLIVDAVVNAYLNFQRDRVQDSTDEMIRLLEAEADRRSIRVKDLREDVKDQMQKLTGRDPFNPAQRNAPIDSPLAALNDRLTQAIVALEVAKANLSANEQKPVRSFIPTDAEILRLVADSPQIRAVHESLREFEEKLANLKSTTPKAEETASYKRYVRRIDELKRSLDRDQRLLFDNIKEEALLSSDQRREEALMQLKDSIERGEVEVRILQEQYDQQVKDATASGGESLELEFLRMELEREEKVFTLISDKTLQLKANQAAPGQVQRIDEKASYPLEPVRWAPWTPLLVVSLLGLTTPFGLALVWERTAKRVADASSLISSDLHVVAEVAALPVTSRSDSYSSSVRSKRELSLFEESIDSLRTGLRLSRQFRDMQVLAVCSAVSREGKTSLSSQLAVSIARSSGEKTLLIDADMRAPNISQVFDIPNEIGLANVLAKENSLEEAIHKGYSELLHLFPAGQLTTSPHKLVGDDSFHRIIDELRKDYRYIIVDTPPILAAGESLVLSVAADAALVCAMRNHSRAEQVREAYTRLERADANPIGVVLNGVPVHRYAYSYGSYGYGYGNYSLGYGRHGQRRS